MNRSQWTMEVRAREKKRYLQCTNEFCFFQSREIDNSEGTFAQRSTEFEIIDGEQSILSTTTKKIHLSFQRSVRITLKPFDERY